MTNLFKIGSPRVLVIYNICFMFANFLTVLESETKNVEIEKVDEDPITKIIGTIGKWQIWICIVVFLVKFPVAWHQMSIIFLAPPMNFTCGGSSEVFDNVCHTNCSDYEYDHSVFKETIVSQWDLVCDRQWLKNLTQTIFMLGILVGNMMFGHLSDRSVLCIYCIIMQNLKYNPDPINS